MAMPSSQTSSLKSMLPVWFRYKFIPSNIHVVAFPIKIGPKTVNAVLSIAQIIVMANLNL